MAMTTPKSSWFQKNLDVLTRSVPAPTSCMVHDREVYRFAERLPQQAAVLKLASFISAHNAVGSLLSQGFIHEAGALQRVQMEAYEDILFICSPLIGLKETELHGTFLEAFWEEEPDFTSFSGHQKNRHTVRRKSIRAYLATIGMEDGADHTAIAWSGYFARTYSGFVHSAAPHIVSLYDPRTDQFKTRGHLCSDLQKPLSEKHGWLSIQGTFAVAYVARALKQSEVECEAYGLNRYLTEINQPWGMPAAQNRSESQPTP